MSKHLCQFIFKWNKSQSKNLSTLLVYISTQHSKLIQPEHVPETGYVLQNTPGKNSFCLISAILIRVYYSHSQIPRLLSPEDRLTQMLRHRHLHQYLIKITL